MMSYINQIKIIFVVFLLNFISSVLAYGENAASNSKKADEPPAKGNFVLPTSQQPGALVGFGQNIVDKNQAQFFLLVDDFSGVNKHTIDVVPGIVYGIRDDLSLFFNVPVTPSLKENQDHSNGLEDIYLQFEYTFYSHSTSKYLDQDTVVANVTFPTGSSKKQPATGFGSPSFFLGATFLRTYVDWLAFTAHGAVLTTTNGGTKFGDQFLYQFGLGRNIVSIDSSWIFAWMIEVDGQYSQKDRIRGIMDPDSGGNVIYLTPSLWISSKKIIIQLGAGVPISQHLFGNQKRNNYLLVADLGCTFV